MFFLCCFSVILADSFCRNRTKEEIESQLSSLVLSSRFSFLPSCSGVNGPWTTSFG